MWIYLQHNDSGNETSNLNNSYAIYNGRLVVYLSNCFFMKRALVFFTALGVYYA
jgi:hypothetical protein